MNDSTMTATANAARVSLLKPGLLVSLKTTIRGGVTYRTADIEADHDEGEGRVARWETTRIIADADEHANAVKARTAARGAILKATLDSSFGLLCPLDDEAKLYAGIAEARTIAAAFNDTARVSRIDVFVIVGRIANSDAEAARAVGAEVRDLIGDMERAVRAADPDAIRAAATKAKNLAGMLTTDAAEKVTAAIAEVRAVARDIVRRVGKAGEQAADVVADVTLARLDAARFAVLDLSGSDAPDDDSAPATEPTAPAIDLPAIDLPDAPSGDDAPTLPAPLPPVHVPAYEFAQGV